jgi:hypothetical protein
MTSHDAFQSLFSALDHVQLHRRGPNVWWFCCSGRKLLYKKDDDKITV